MAWIREVFLTILNMSVTAGITILVILAVRAVFRKAPRKYLYVLWLVAALRLVCPWAPESGMSLFNLSLIHPAESAGGTQVWYAPAEAEISGGDTGDAAAGRDQSPGAAAGSPDSEVIQQAEGTESGSGTAGTASSYEPQAQGSPVPAAGSRAPEPAAGGPGTAEQLCRHSRTGNCQEDVSRRVYGSLQSLAYRDRSLSSVSDPLLEEGQESDLPGRAP